MIIWSKRSLQLKCFNRCLLTNVSGHFDNNHAFSHKKCASQLIVVVVQNISFQPNWCMKKSLKIGRKSLDFEVKSLNFLGL